MAKPPAGWYIDQDRSGTERWFDGDEWTEFRRHVEGTTRPSPTASSAVEQPVLAPPTTTPAPEDVDATRSSAWHSAVERWNQIFAAVPADPVLKLGMFARAPKGYSPRELKGRDLNDIAQGWGRPTFWSPEPATDGVICGWSFTPPFAIHLTADATCDEVFQPKSNEIDLSWRMRRLGNVIGKPIDHVETMIGLPQARSSIGLGMTLLQWHAVGYHVALKFDPDDYCLGITSQHANRPI